MFYIKHKNNPKFDNLRAASTAAKQILLDGVDADAILIWDDAHVVVAVVTDDANGLYTHILETLK